MSVAGECSTDGALSQVLIGSPASHTGRPLRLKHAAAAVVAALVVAFSGCGGGEPAERSGPAERSSGKARTGSSEPVLGTATTPAVARPSPVRRSVDLTPAQLAGQHVVFSFQGTSPPPALVQRIARGEAAGVVLFGRNIQGADQLRGLVDQLQRIRRPKWGRAPLLVMIDEEGGRISRTPGLRLPSARQIGSQGDPEAAQRAGVSAASGLRSAGINVNLAPVADVAIEGSVIGEQERSYAGDPATVTRFASAFAAGLSDGGVAATAKHFPGFGAATSNTDHRPVTISRDLASLRRVEMRPFRALAEAGIPLVMVSTAVYPALSSAPAALSRRVVTTELRDSVSFTGVTITDDLETPATLPLGSPEVLAERAVAAGNDLLIFAKTFEAGERAATGLRAALEGGRVSKPATIEAVRRVLALRRTLG